MDDPKPPTPASENTTPKSENTLAKPPLNPEERRKVAGRIISIAVIAGTVLLILWVWSVVERHPRTDDAIAQANVINVAPRVGGQIIKLNVQDNQEVKEGDVLFEIDPADYELALENAKAALASLDQQIEVARSQDEAERQAKLAAAQGDLTDEKTKTTALTKERDEALKAAKGGSVLRRIARAAKWFAIGAAAGAIAAKSAH